MNTGPDSSTSEASEQQARIDSIAQDWFLLMSSGEPSNEDHLRFQHWLDENPQHRHAYNELSELWGDIGGLRNAFASPAGAENGSISTASAAKVNCEKKVNSEKKFNNNRSHQNFGGTSPLPKYKSAIKNVFWGGAMAACLALVIVNTSNISTRWTSDHHTAVGEQAQVELPDGSIAWLNTDTAIDVRYNEDRREVALLRGEAQFDVQKNPKRPFVVTANSGQSTALGTVYAVRKQNDAVLVTVTEGRVEIVSPWSDAANASFHSANTNPGRVVLKHGEQTRYTKGAPPSSVEKAHTETTLSWRRGFIAIRNQPLSDALAEIDRYHPGRIVLLADAEKLKSVTARLAISSLDKGLDALAATQGLTVTRISDHLVLVR